MSCDTYFYELGKRLLRPAAGSRPSAPGLGECASGFGELDRRRPRPRVARARSRRPSSLQPDVPPRARATASSTALEAGLLDPDGDRTGQTPRDAAADDPPLRDDRERRQARDAAPRRRRRADRAERRAGARSCAASAPSRRRRPASTRRRLRYVQQGLYEATHSSFGTGVGVFGSFPVPIAGKTGSAEKNRDAPG